MNKLVNNSKIIDEGTKIVSSYNDLISKAETTIKALLVEFGGEKKEIEIGDYMMSDMQYSLVTSIKLNENGDVLFGLKSDMEDGIHLFSYTPMKFLPKYHIINLLEKLIEKLQKQ